MTKQLRIYLRATHPSSLRLWRRMPDDWTRVSDLIGKGQGFTSVFDRLAKLHAAGAVERRKVGREMQYRPIDWFRVEAEMKRGA